MKIFEATERPSALITDLLQIWENSVRSTHTFLSESEILEIRKFVPQAFAGVSRLVIATENGRPTAFMGTEGQKLEMLFVAPEMRGKGIGKALLLHATEKYSVNELTVKIRFFRLCRRGRACRRVCRPCGRRNFCCRRGFCRYIFSRRVSFRWE